MLEATVLPLRLAKAKEEREGEENKKARESAYRCDTIDLALHVLSALDTRNA